MKEARYVIKFEDGKVYVGKWFDLSKTSIMQIEYESQCHADALSHAETFYLEYRG